MRTVRPDIAPILVFGWGNPSRGDDALGPLFVERASALVVPKATVRVEFLTDFQLQVEHALDLVGRERVLFVDASLDATAPFETTPVHAAAERGVSTHAMSPAAVLQVFQNLYDFAPPACTLLAIPGVRFELGEPLGDVADSNLTSALAWFPGWLAGTPRGLADEALTCTS